MSRVPSRFGGEAWCAAIYFYARVAHAVIHVSGVGLFMARTVAFVVAWGALIITFAVAVLLRAV